MYKKRELRDVETQNRRSFKWTRLFKWRWQRQLKYELMTCAKVELSDDAKRYSNSIKNARKVTVNASGMLEQKWSRNCGGWEDVVLWLRSRVRKYGLGVGADNIVAENRSTERTWKYEKSTGNLRENVQSFTSANSANWKWGSFQCIDGVRKRGSWSHVFTKLTQ